MYAQEPHVKQVQGLMALQDAVAQERSKLEALQKELQAKRTELNAQVWKMESVKPMGM